MSVTETFLTSDTWIAPAGVTLLESLEVWSGGGAGASGVTGALNGGGGGGGYARWTDVPVFPGDTYNVGVGTSSDTDGNVSNFSGGTSVFYEDEFNVAPGGLGTTLVAGEGGNPAASETVPTDTNSPGGNGARIGGVGTSGGGGGSSGGVDAGNNAVGATGGTAVLNGGAGGNGGGNNQNGQDGEAPGGGGGGAGTNVGDKEGGLGARGQVRLTYTLPGSVAAYANGSNVILQR